MTREEAIRRIKAWNLDTDDMEVLSVLAPELAESEDERIRKRLIDCLKLSLKGAEEQDSAGCSRQKDIEAYKWGIDYFEKQKEQKPKMIQWTGKNLKEVIDFTGKSPRFDEWFKSWEEYENYVHSHNNILKLFCEDGSHYEVPVGSWIVKTPDGFNIPSLFKFVQKPAEYIEFDDEFKNQVSHLLASVLNGEHDYTEGFVKYVSQSLLEYAKNELKSSKEDEQQPAEWSEEDERYRNRAVFYTRCYQRIEGDIVESEKCIAWLKSLRPQSHWKPSEEQMGALEHFIRSWGESGTMSPQNPILCAAKSLYNELKKL